MDCYEIAVAFEFDLMMLNYAMYMVCAASQGNGPGVASLLKHGADPLLKDDKGRLALHYVGAIF